MEAKRRAGPKLHSRREFRLRVLAFAAFGFGIVSLSLLAGMLGYRIFADMRWIDALHSSALILTGMGPVEAMHDDAAKLFDSLFALYGGAVYPVVTAVVLYPLLHRMLMLMHLEQVSVENGGHRHEASHDG